MKRLTPKQAEEQNYRAITTDIWPHRETEKHIPESIERSMRGCDAVWIEMPYEGAIQCARKVSEIILSENATNRLRAKA